jgi:hypothetical protein
MKHFAVALMGPAAMALGLTEKITEPVVPVDPTPHGEGWKPEPVAHYHTKKVPDIDIIPAGTVIGSKYVIEMVEEEQDVKVCREKKVQRTKKVQKIVDYEEKDVVVGQEMLHFPGCHDVQYEYEETIVTPMEKEVTVCLEYEELEKEKVRIVEREEHKLEMKKVEHDAICTEKVERPEMVMKRQENTIKKPIVRFRSVEKHRPKKVRRTKSYDKHVYKQVLKDCSEDSHSFHGFYAQVEEKDDAHSTHHFGYGHSDTSSESECYTFKQFTITTHTSYESFTEETYSTKEPYYTETDTEYSFEGPVKEFYDDYIEKPCIKKAEEEYFA